MTRGGILVVTLALLVAAPAFARSAGPVTRLAITVWPRGTTDPLVRHYRLGCDPAAGTVPQPARACRALARLAAPFAPVPPHTVCAQITLGPQEAVVTGLLRGRSVRTRLTLRDSCEIERWRRVSLVVPGFPRSA